MDSHYSTLDTSVFFTKKKNIIMWLIARSFDKNKQKYLVVFPQFFFLISTFVSIYIHEQYEKSTALH